MLLPPCCFSPVSLQLSADKPYKLNSISTDWMWHISLYTMQIKPFPKEKLKPSVQNLHTLQILEHDHVTCLFSNTEKLSVVLAE